MKEGKVHDIVDALVLKYINEREKHLGFGIIEECIQLVRAFLPDGIIKKSGDWKLDDEFLITDRNNQHRFKIKAFYTKNSVYGVRSNHELPTGQGYYNHIIVPINRLAKCKVKKVKLPKVKVGDYFQTKLSTVVYKAITKLPDDRIQGTNKLQYMGATTNITVHLSNVIPATKKAYKEQHNNESTPYGGKIENPKKKKDDKKKGKRSKKKTATKRGKKKK